MASTRLVLVGAAAMLAASAALATVHTFPITMRGVEEIPGPGDPDGTAEGTLTIDDATNMVSWSFTYANIGPPTDMHIHVGAAGVGGGVVVPMGAGTTGGPGTLVGSTTTSAANVTNILNNPIGFYVNVHNAAFPPGAIRGQIPKVFNLTMTGDQEVPGPGDPDGMASGPIAFDTGSNTISWDFVYSNLDPLTAMHIHPGAAGMSGGVFIGMGIATTGGPGTLISSTTTSAANMNMVLANPQNFYVNIHTTAFGPGAVRGQVDGSVPMDPCPTDLDGDGSTGASDLAQLLGQWGTDGPADFNDDGTVGAADLATILGSWGPCP